MGAAKPFGCQPCRCSCRWRRLDRWPWGSDTNYRANEAFAQAIRSLPSILRPSQRDNVLADLSASSPTLTTASFALVWVRRVTHADKHDAVSAGPRRPPQYPYRRGRRRLGRLQHCHLDDQPVQNGCCRP
jgi:hypothetical protein